MWNFVLSLSLLSSFPGPIGMVSICCCCCLCSSSFLSFVPASRYLFQVFSSPCSSGLRFLLPLFLTFDFQPFDVSLFSTLFNPPSPYNKRWLNNFVWPLNHLHTWRSAVPSACLQESVEFSINKGASLIGRTRVRVRLGLGLGLEIGLEVGYVLG